jgi:outer membrane protein OmpA-like peptidoglycan-associated protein
MEKRSCSAFLLRYIYRVKSVLVTYFLLQALLLSSQNLIPNPGFEEVFTDLEYQWVQPQGPYYHYEKTDSLTLHHAHSGDYVNGLCMYNNRENEFLHVKLRKPLEAGKTYKISCQAQLMRAKCFNARVQKLIGVHFGRNSLDTHIPGDLYLKPQVNWELPDSGRFNWFELSETYIAQGGEAYITLGYFAATQSEEIRRSEGFGNSDVQTEEKDDKEDMSWLYLPPEEQKKYIKTQKKKAKKRRKNSEEEAIDLTSFEKPESAWKHLPETGTDPTSKFFMVRYYFDDFCLAEVEEDGTVDCSVESVPAKLEAGNSITLRNVFFETDESKLLQESEVQLNALGRLLYDYPEMKIELRGYTDDRGEIEYNLNLSKERAASVKEWLVEYGVDPGRMSSIGFGENNPVETNDTEAGRARNRRVEFFIVNM